MNVHLLVRDGILPGHWDDEVDDEVLLRKFDLDLKYGPCSGLNRMQRWQRAQSLGLEPPSYIFDILNKVEIQLKKQRDSESEKKKPSTTPASSVSSKETVTKVNGVSTHSLFHNVVARAENH